MSVPARRHFRILRAYWVAAKILASIGTARLLGRIRGEAWLAENMPEIHRMNARRLKEVILQLRGLFIKVGQLISILSNFLPEDFREELEELQDRIPPQPYEEITARIHSEFGKSPEALFASFEHAPIASASLAQVHKARLHDGRVVAVKVQYLDIEDTARMDLRAIRRILRVVSLFTGLRGLDASFIQLRDMILEELDFKKEAQNIEAIAPNFQGNPLVSVPVVIGEFSSQTVLTTEFIEGIKVSDLAKLESLDIDLKALAERIVNAYCQMIFTDGIYHADPHPGNIFVKPDGAIVFIDFGAVATLSRQMKQGLPLFLEGLIKRDTEQIVKSLRMMGFVAYDKGERQAQLVIDYFYEQFLEQLAGDSWSLRDVEMDIQKKSQVLGDLRQLNVSFRDLTNTFEVPKDWILLERTILLLLGLCTLLDPEMNPMQTIQPYLEEFVLGKDKDAKALFAAALKDMVFSAVTIPADVRRILTKANRGEMEVSVRGLRESAKLIYALGHQLLYGAFATTCGGFSYFAFIQGDRGLAKLLGVASVFFLICMTRSIWSARRWHRNE